MLLDGFKVNSAPDTVYYVPDFISEVEETALLKNFYEAPKPKWTYLSNRRLQNWGGLPHAKGMVQENIPQWLSSLMERVSVLGMFGDKSANHSLVNEYLPGQGILPHHDGSLYYPTVTTVSLGSHTLLDFYEPLMEDTKQEASHTSYASRYAFSFLLEPRSLVVLQSLMYTHYLHGITECSEDVLEMGIRAELPEASKRIVNRLECPSLHKMSDTSGDSQSLTLTRSTRVSITIRHVPKVLKIKFSFLS